MALLPLLAATLIQGQTPAAAPAAAESVKLSRTYKEGDKDSYVLHVKMGEGAAEMEAVIASIVEKTLPAGHATIKLEAQTSGAGADELPEAMEGNFDEHGMADNYTFDHNGWMYLLVTTAGFIPTGDASANKDLKVDWSNKDNTYGVKGTAHVDKIDTVDGQKVAVMTEKVTVTVPQQGGNAEVTNKATILLDTGKLLKAEGSVEIGGQGHMEFKVDQKKKS